MPRYWMITNRDVRSDGLGKSRKGLTYWVCDKPAVDRFQNWGKVSEKDFRDQLVAAADNFPALPDDQHEDQKHVTLFVHGYNNSWDGAAKAYRTIAEGLFGGQTSMGLCVLFTWPSNGSPAEYLADRGDAAASGADLADVLQQLYDWLLKKQAIAVRKPDEACRAKTSLIAHSMGNYVLQKAMQSVWTRANQPLLVSLINQLLMVAADVDNDLFKSGESFEKTDGDAIANLTYRATVLYSGMDETLGLSAGLKHFGKRRLGRSGLDDTEPVPDNVCQFDCSPHFKGMPGPYHGAYFRSPKTFALMRSLLRGIDRNVLASGAPGRG